MSRVDDPDWPFTIVVSDTLPEDHILLADLAEPQRARQEKRPINPDAFRLIKIPTGHAEHPEEQHPMSDPAPEITAIVKHRYETGAYGNAHFRVTAELRARLLTLAPPPERYTIPPRPLGDMLGIPVAVDDSMPRDEWRLVDNSSGEILFRGTVPAEDPEEQPSG